MRLFYAWEFVKTNQYPQLAGAIDIKTPLWKFDKTCI
jgi:hypothetical protein